MKKAFAAATILLASSALAAATSGSSVTKKQPKAKQASAPAVVSSRVTAAAQLSPIVRDDSIPRPVTQEKAILVLQTRNHQITVFAGEADTLYSVRDEWGLLLAEKVKPADLKVQFPHLYDIVTGTAWAGLR